VSVFRRLNLPEVGVAAGIGFLAVWLIRRFNVLL
jgi:hypothetical protein